MHKNDPFGFLEAVKFVSQLFEVLYIDLIMVDKFEAIVFFAFGCEVCQFVQQLL